jgi:hypothetical protein
MEGLLSPLVGTATCAPNEPTYPPWWKTRLAELHRVARAATLSCRLALQGWIGHVVPGAVATSLAWVLAGALVLLSAVSIVDG